jgi:acyl-CoA thioesterase-1
MRIWTIAAIVLCGSAPFAAGARAEPVVITALGASNTAGKGVGSSLAFPAQLEAMLRARGHDVRVINAGVNGDTPQGMLARLNSAVPPATRVVILNPGGNDLRGCKQRRGNGICATRGEHAASVARVVRAIKARGMRVVMANFGGFSDADRQADGRHLTPEVHRRVAARLMPQVLAAIGGKAARSPRMNAAAGAESSRQDAPRRGDRGAGGDRGATFRGGTGSDCAEDRRRFCGAASRDDCRLGRYLKQLSPACRARVMANKRRR